MSGTMASPTLPSRMFEAMSPSDITTTNPLLKISLSVRTVKMLCIELIRLLTETIQLTTNGLPTLESVSSLRDALHSTDQAFVDICHHSWSTGVIGNHMRNLDSVLCDCRAVLERLQGAWYQYRENQSVSPGLPESPQLELYSAILVLSLDAIKLYHPRVIGDNSPVSLESPRGLSPRQIRDEFLRTASEVHERIKHFEILQVECSRRGATEYAVIDRINNLWNLGGSAMKVYQESKVVLPGQDPVGIGVNVQRGTREVNMEDTQEDGENSAPEEVKLSATVAGPAFEANTYTPTPLTPRRLIKSATFARPPQPDVASLRRATTENTRFPIIPQKAPEQRILRVNTEGGEPSLPSQIKLVIVGDANVGKTSLVRLASKGTLPRCSFPRRFEEFVCEMDGISQTISLWDITATPGRGGLKPMAYRDACGFVLCFGIDDLSSLQNVETKWKPEISDYITRGQPILLLGLKRDVRDGRRRLWQRYGQGCVTPEEGEEVCQAIGAEAYHECSAETGEGVEDAIRDLVVAIVEGGSPKVQAKSPLQEQAGNCVQWSRRDREMTEPPLSAYF